MKRTRLFKTNRFNIPLYADEWRRLSLIILDIYNTTPLIYHLQIIKEEYYNIYFYYPALSSCCKQTLIHHQSPGSFYKLEKKVEMYAFSRRLHLCCVRVSGEIGCESVPLHLLFIEPVERSIY